MRITAIVGTRPQLIKLAAIRPHLTAPIEPFVIDTAQHHDELLADHRLPIERKAEA